ncbi:hypothetical protein DEO72_LG11g2467 [Vigna unguiculata]|uniref:Uncharacterized protein n=1 Tax=Vigna unguiculata TaxID=3917 RepID=A0A4D6NPB5_VIGUN|nr:hypothetical protein DEO72_LG11g2467 [Vigna unguiculata]
MHEQWRNSTCFAQATPSCLGESCRSSYRVRLEHFAQATKTGTTSRLGEVGVVFEQWRPRLGLSETSSRLGERYSPKRGRAESCAFFSTTSRLGEVGVVFEQWRPRLGLSETSSRLGERYSPKRGRAESCAFFSTTSRLGEVGVVFEQWYGSLRRENLA